MNTTEEKRVVIFFKRFTEGKKKKRHVILVIFAIFWLFNRILKYLNILVSNNIPPGKFISFLLRVVHFGSPF